MSALKNNHDIMSLKSDGCVYYLDIKYIKDTVTKYSIDPLTNEYIPSPYGIYVKDKKGKYDIDFRTKYTYSNG